MYYLQIIAAIGLNVGSNIQMNEFMKVNEYQRSRSLFDLGRKVTHISKLNLVFLRTCCVIKN